MPKDCTNHWGNLFEQASVKDNRPIIKALETNWDFLKPIEYPEIKKALRRMGNSAPGPDGVTPKALGLRNAQSLRALLNMMLVLEATPDHLAMARVVLIPKCDNPMLPSEYRPISISPVIVRCLNGILAERWSNSLLGLNSQMAFLKRDGCFDANVILDTTLKQAQRDCQNMAICSVDIAKAFDSISHDTIKRVASMYGAPDPLVISLSAPNVKLMIGNGSISSIAYADDLIILASSNIGLQHKLNTLSKNLEKCGLKINTDKSFSIRRTKLGKEGKSCITNSTFTVDGTKIRPLNNTDTFKYLGIPYGVGGVKYLNMNLETIKMMTELDEAPISITQKLEILQSYAIPKLHYKLQLGM
ncbi:unnamed protein product, partial [Trichobilharzia regenti]